MYRYLLCIVLFLTPCAYAWNWPWEKDNVATANAKAGIQLKTSVEGLPTPLETNVQNRLASNIDNLPIPLDPLIANSFYEQSAAAVTAGISPYSYFSPTIHKSLTTTDKHWLLNYQVKPGPISVITKISVQIIGPSVPELQTIIDHPPFKLNDAFLSDSYETYKDTLISTANQLGYINAQFSEHRVLVNRDTHSVEIYLTLDLKQSYLFGPVSFQKNPLSTAFLQKFVPFKTGKHYTPGDTLLLQKQMNNSGYFQQVDVLPELDKVTSENAIPIQVNVTPKPRQQYTFGAGFGTDTGPRISAGTNWNYVTDTGHKLMMMTRLSQVQNMAITKYTIPGNNPLEDQYNVNGSLTTNTISQGSSQIRQLGSGFSHSHDGWQTNLNLSYQLEHYSFNNDPYQTSHLLLPSLSFQKITSDNPLYPTRGNSFNFMVQGAKENVLSDTNLIQARLQDKWLFPVTEESQMLLKTDLGYTAIHDQNLLPLSLSFFAGGSQSIRGYGYNELGPGRYLITASAEFRHKIVTDWYAATFIDIGNTFDNLPNGATSGIKSKIGSIYNNMERGVGVGIGWNSPVGPMQLSLAKAVTLVGEPNRIQFNMGTSL